MTQARQKGSLRHGGPEGWDSCPTWAHGGTMGGAWPERTLRYGRTKKISEFFKRGKGPVRTKPDRRGKKPKEDARGKLGRRRDKKRDRKSYPLRGRTGVSDGGGLSCRVLLTRLEESVRERDGSEERERKRAAKARPRKGTRRARREAKPPPPPKSKSKASRPSLGEWFRVLQPRERRLASLNAEAVNSLLFERAVDPQARRQDPATGGGAPPGAHLAPGASKSPRGNGKALRPDGLEPCHAAKPDKKAKDDTSGVSRDGLDAPAPRRLAGLNAAALLKLTSCSATSKQRTKAAPAATVTSDGRAPAGVSSPKPKGRSRKRTGAKAPPLPGGGAALKADFEPKVEWETGGCAHRLTKPGYLAYPLKQVKEEQLEAELSPYCCCPPEGSVEYCHRLAFFLGQQPFEGSDERPLGSPLGPVKRECLVAPPPLTHPHPHPHAALALSPHPCLCTADHCFSSYYVHIAHPTHTGPASPALASRPLTYPPSGLCPNPMAGPKLLNPRAHPAYCNPVAPPCYGGYTYRAMPPVSSRACSFSAGCTRCTQNIKTEGYSSPPQGDHSPSSLLAQPSLPVSSCPLSSAPAPAQPQPHPLAPLSGADQAQARLRLARECPRSGKPSDGSPSIGRTRLQQKRPPPASDLGGGGKQRKVSRRRATNGWRPVGVPTEREVFIAGEDESSLRQCYEGVERDGEVIRVRDTVLLRSGPRKKSLPYVAKISALWEDPKTGELMMSLFWYYRPEHTQGGRDPSAHCENEIFASRHQDENSVACIEDRCYVLPLAQYCRFCALAKRRAEGAAPGSASVVPRRPDFAPPSHRCVPTDVDPELVYLCRHVYDFRYGRILKNLQ